MEDLDISDINLFSRYILEKNSSFAKNLHIPYFIGSPIKLFKDSSLSKKNDALLPVVILIKKSDGTYDFEEVAFNWGSVDLLQTYSKIKPNGQLQYLKNIKSFEKLFDEVKIDVNINEVKEITLKDVVEEYQFFRRLSPALIDKYKEEKFLLFSDQMNNYIIPAVEVVRYFYCYSQSDSLKQSIFHPSGLKLMAKKCDWHTDTNRYDLYLETLCEIVDNKKIFYFVHDEEYLNMFHNIYYQYKNTNLISAIFPFKDNFSMICKTLKLSEESNSFLITRVIDSNMLNSFFTDTGIDLHVYHPLSKEREAKTGKRDTKYDKKTRVPRKAPVDFNDQLSSAASLPVQTASSEENIDYFPEEKVESIVETNGKREERGGITKNIPIDVNDLSTASQNSDTEKTAQQVRTSSRKNKIKEYPQPSISSKADSFNEISDIEKLFKQKGFESKGFMIFDFPDKTNGEKRAISYTDKEMIIRRRYLLLKLSKNNANYIYMDVEAKNGNKEILILVNQDEPIAHKCMYQQVHYGNHKWLSKTSLNLQENVDFVRIRHSETAKQIVENIMHKTNL